MKKNIFLLVTATLLTVGIASAKPVKGCEPTRGYYHYDARYDRDHKRTELRRDRKERDRAIAHGRPGEARHEQKEIRHDRRSIHQEHGDRK
jgi:hypothetical protein